MCCRGWELKGALFQSFIKQPEAISIPNQQFDAVTATIDEHEHIATEGILVEVRADQPTETIKAAAHVRGLSVEEKMELGKDRQHLS